jgi:glucosylceramidase
MQTAIHDQFPSLPAYDTEHSGGTWIANQQQDDMHNIVDYTRNWGRTVTKWSLAVDQNMGPHNGGCGTCTGLVTVHNGDARSGQVDFTVGYYDMGHLTKFVRPGAFRIASTASAVVPNVALRNPDGSTALVAYNDAAGAQTVRVNWGGSSFAYSLPAKTTGTFTWAGLTVDGWTIMPFEFGGNGQDMGALSTQSAEGLRNRLVAAYGYSADQAYRHSGISSMNGITDVGENVSVADFRTTLAYAQAHHLARLTFWSVNRDRPCADGVADSCGGVAQAAWDYTRVFAAYRA